MPAKALETVIGVLTPSMGTVVTVPCRLSLIPPTNKPFGKAYTRESGEPEGVKLPSAFELRVPLPV